MTPGPVGGRGGPYDLLVIGGGPAGISGAIAASFFGLRAALIDPGERIGGAGIVTGTIPSKALRESSLVISGWRARRLLGVDIALRQGATVEDFTRHAHRVTADEIERLTGRLDALGVTTFRGRARFTSPCSVAVTLHDGGALELTGRAVLVATGSSPVRPEIFPFEHPRVHDSNEILEIGTLPESLAVVGAGVIGAEYACTFAALGVEVHLIDGRDTLLPFLDHEVSSRLMSAMTGAGIRFHGRERVRRCEPVSDARVRLGLQSGEELEVSDVLVAAGRSSNTGDLDLAAAGLVPGTRGLLSVDRHYRTAVDRIYAAGDVVGPPALASTSMEQARVAICHAFDLMGKEFASLLPTGIYTIPEASMVGDTEQGLREQGVDFLVGRASYLQSPRGLLMGDTSGFLKLLFRRGDMRLLGVHVLGEQATELVHIGMVAMQCRATAELFNTLCFNYPTLGDLYKYAAYDALLQARSQAV